MESEVNNYSITYSIMVLDGLNSVAESFVESDSFGAWSGGCESFSRLSAFFVLGEIAVQRVT